MRSASLAVARCAKRIQPAHDIFDSRIPHLRILSILCQHFVAFDHRDQKARGLFRNQVAADCSQRLPPPQCPGNCFLQGTEDTFQSLAELLVEPRHLLCQIDQGTAILYVSWPSWYRLYNTDQSIDRVLVLAPSQSFLAFEMVVERSFRDVGRGQNCIYSRALEAHFVDLSKSRLQQALPRLLSIAC